MRHHFGRVAFQALGVIENAEAALLAKRLQIVALLAGGRAGIGDNDGDQREAGRGEVGIFGEQVLDAMEGRDAEVRFVGAVAAHGLLVGHAGERRGDGEPGHSADAFEQRFDDREDGFLLGKAHLQIDLGELVLAIGAEIFVAETADDLEVLIEAADHQQLLEDLRGLRQGVKIAGVHTAGDKEVARAFGGGFCEKRRFDFEEALGVENFADGKANLGAQNDIFLHPRTAEVHVAVLQAGVFIDVHVVFHGEWRGAALVENPDFFGDDFHFAGGEIGIDGLRRTDFDEAFHGDDVFRAEHVRFIVRFGERIVRVKDELGDAFAVAEVDENDASEIAAAVNPTH